MRSRALTLPRVADGAHLLVDAGHRRAAAAPRRLRGSRACSPGPRIVTSTCFIVPAPRVAVCRPAGARAARRCARAPRPGASAGCRVRRQRRQLLLEQRVGALEFLVPQQQPFDAFGEVFELGHGGVAGAAIIVGRGLRARGRRRVESHASGAPWSQQRARCSVRTAAGAPGRRSGRAGSASGARRRGSAGGTRSQQARFDLERRAARRQPGAVGDAEDVRVHRDRRLAEGDVQHHVGGLAADAGQRLAAPRAMRGTSPPCRSTRRRQVSIRLLRLGAVQADACGCRRSTPSTPSASIACGVRRQREQRAASPC